MTPEQYKFQLEEGIIFIKLNNRKTSQMDTLVSQAVAVLAKEKGFNLPTYHGYENGEFCEYFTYQSYAPGEPEIRMDDFLKTWEVQVPTQTQLQKWLREKHNIHIKIDITNIGRYYTQIYHFEPKEKSTVLFFHSQNVSTIKFDTYEEALEYGLMEALKLI